MCVCVLPDGGQYAGDREMSAFGEGEERSSAEWTTLHRKVLGTPTGRQAA